MKLRRIFCAIAIAVTFAGNPAYGAEIDESKLRPGLLMDFYTIENEDTPSKPTGRSIATLIYSEGFPVSYYKPFEIEASLERFRDRWWLLEWRGYIDLKQDGDYTFAHSLTSNNDASCGGTLALNGKELISQDGASFDAYKNEFTDLRLNAGLYEFKASMFCTKRRNSSTIPRIEIGIRGPSDPMVNPIDSANLFYLAN